MHKLTADYASTGDVTGRASSSMGQEFKQMITEIARDAGIGAVSGGLFEKIIKNLTVSPGTNRRAS
jgi:hypothetical protein